MNKNDEYLLNILRQNEMIISNILIAHLLAHLATYAATEGVKDITSHDENMKRNPFRNQYIYILATYITMAILSQR